MKLSVNYSIELANLLKEGIVDVDLIKCADWPDMIATARRLKPVYVHFPLDAGSTSGRAANYAAADAMARDTGTPYVNMHLVTWHRDFPTLPADSVDADLLAQVTELMLEHVADAAAFVRPDRLILENIPYFGPKGEFHRASVEPAVIRRVVEQSGCGFLLDLSHARIAAHYLGVDPYDYVAQLPVERIRELHVTGVRPVKGRLSDHMDLSDEDWRFVTFALKRIRAGDWARPWTIALEYGGIGEPFAWRSDQRVLERQVPRLHEVVKE
jgi:uncharacterized protein (UPF0276 family)